jgi:N-acetylmuramoyl-L-alanine amidase
MPLFAILTAFFGGLTLVFPQKIQAAFADFGFLPQPKAQQTVSSYDLDILARTLWGEARGQGYHGMQAVANVIMRRYELAQQNVSFARQFGATVADICQKPYQFSVWLVNDPNYQKMLNVTANDPRFEMAQEIALKALTGRLRDVTGGADHYLNIAATKAQRGGSLPKWVNLTKKTEEIGDHTFLRLSA